MKEFVERVIAYVKATVSPAAPSHAMSPVIHPLGTIPNEGENFLSANPFVKKMKNGDGA